MPRLRFLFAILCVIFIANGYTVCDFAKIEEAKRKALKMSRNCGSRMDVHKAIIAAYFICPGDLAFDLGAYVGDYSLYFQKLVGERGKVIAYEASPPIFQVLEKRLKKASNVILKNRAVSCKSGEKILMNIYPDNIAPQCCSVEKKLWNVERMPGNTKAIEVETEKLDDILTDQSMPSVHFIKIDVEGHEHAVFEGAKELLKNQRPLVVFEYGRIKDYWETPTIQQMEDMNYVCYDCATDQRVRPGYEVPMTDLLAIPAEREQEIAEILPYLHFNRWEMCKLRVSALINRVF